MHQIAKAILWGFKKWQNHSEATETRADAPFIHNQEALGWDHFLDGWVVHSWHTYQETIWHSVWSWCSSCQWVAELIKKVWNVSWDMWAHQNRILHNSTQAKMEIVEKRINDQIHSIYETKSQTLSQDALIFIWKPKEQILQLPLVTKQQWLESVEVAMACKECHEYDGCYLSKQWYLEMWLIHKWYGEGERKKEKMHV